MARKVYRQRLLITPLLSESQIGTASVDVRLGSTILLLRRARVGSIDVTEENTRRTLDKTTYEVSQIRYFRKFTLHPRSLILGSTFEYLSLPYDVSATLVSRSSWGRLGLVIATASIVHPGFKGCLTLELANLGESPITLYPGMLIGQLELNAVQGGEEHVALDGGRYDCPVEPEPPKFGARDPFELTFWTPAG
jgi:dCTP deaminase